MRTWMLSAFTFISAFALAEGTELAADLGTKPDLTVSAQTSAPTGPVVSGLEITQLIIVLGAIFLILKFGLPKLIAKYGKKISTPFDSGIQLQESANFGGGNLQVIKVRGKTLLLAVTQTGVNCLADLTDAPEQTDTDPAFFELLDKAKSSDEVQTNVRAAVLMDDGEEEPVQAQEPKANPKVKAYQKPTAEPKAELSDEELSQDLQARLKRLSQLVN